MGSQPRALSQAFFRVKRLLLEKKSFCFGLLL